MSRFRTLATAAITTGSALALSAPAASAGTPLDGTGETSYASGKTGACSAHSLYDVSAAGSTESDTIKVTAGVDSNRAAQSWSRQLLHNGVRFASGTATTQDPSGAFAIRRQTNNVLGADTIRFLATNPRTGESCDGLIVLP